MATADIIIKGRDDSSAAVRSAKAGLMDLNREVKGIGQAFSQAGRIAVALGNEQLASLTMRASLMSSTFKAAGEVITKIGFAKAGIVGVAVAMAGFVFQRAMAERQRLAAQLKEEADAHKALETSIKATSAAQADLNAKIKAGAIGAGRGSALQGALGNQSLTQSARQSGVVIGDPINSPTNAAKAVEELAKTEAEAAKQKLEAQRLIAEKNEENWANYEAILEQQKLKEQEVADAKIAAEENAWEIYDAIHEARKLREQEQLRMAEENSRRRMQLAEQEAAREKFIRERRIIATQTMFGDLATIAKAFGKEGFAAYKAAASAEAIVAAYLAASKAYENFGGWPYGVIPAAISLAAGLANVAVINSTQAHAGVESMPEDQTVLLQQGERVVKTGQNERLEEMIERDENGGRGGGDIVLDGIKITRWIYEMSRSGQLKISSRAMVA